MNQIDKSQEILIDYYSLVTRRWKLLLMVIIVFLFFGGVYVFFHPSTGSIFTSTIKIGQFSSSVLFETPEQIKTKIKKRYIPELLRAHGISNSVVTVKIDPSLGYNIMSIRFFGNNIDDKTMLEISQKATDLLVDEHSKIVNAQIEEADRNIDFQQKNIEILLTEKKEFQKFSTKVSDLFQINQARYQNQLYLENAQNKLNEAHNIIETINQNQTKVLSGPSKEPKSQLNYIIKIIILMGALGFIAGLCVVGIAEMIMIAKKKKKDL